MWFFSGNEEMGFAPIILNDGSIIIAKVNRNGGAISQLDNFKRTKAIAMNNGGLDFAITKDFSWPTELKAWLIDCGFIQLSTRCRLTKNQFAGTFLR